MWALLESGGLSILSLAVLFVIARFLGPTDLGTVALALGIVQMLAIIPETLVHDALVQRPNLDDDHLNTAFWTCLAIGLTFSMGCWLGAPLLARIFGSPGLAPLISVAALSLGFSGAGSVAIAVLRRNFLFKALALRSLYGRLFGAIVAIAMVFLGAGVWSLIAQYLIQTAVNVLFVWRATPWRPHLRFSSQHLRDLLSFGVFSMGTRIVWLSSTKLFTILVGYFVGVTAVGYLNVAQRVVDTLHDMLAGAAYNLALPIFSRRQDDHVALARAFHTGTEFAGLALAPIFGGVAACATPIIALFVGPEWLPAAPVVQVLAIAAMLEFPFLFADAAMTALGRPGYIFTVSLLALAFVLIAFSVLPPTTVLIAAILWGSRILITAPAVFVLLNRLIHRTMLDLGRESWAPLFGTAVMAAAVWAMETYVLPAQQPLVVLLVVIPFGALVYAAVIVGIKRDSLHRLLLFIISGIRGGSLARANNSEATIQRPMTRKSCEPSIKREQHPGLTENDVVAS
jgi:PST family polysaccharide transporter